jgi:ribosomal protein S2
MLRTRSPHYFFFDFEPILFELRRIIGFLVNFFESTNYLVRILITNGTPRRVDEYLDAASKALQNFSNVFLLKWMPGTFTNCSVVYRYWARKYYKRLRNKVARRWREYNQPTAVKLTWIPDLLITLSLAEIYTPMIGEIARLRVPTLGVIDSDVSSQPVTYVLRGNDDSMDSLLVYLKLVRACIRHGQYLAKTHKLNEIKLSENNLKEFQNKSKNNKKTKHLKNISKVIQKIFENDSVKREQLKKDKKKAEQRDVRVVSLAESMNNRLIKTRQRFQHIMMSIRHTINRKTKMNEIVNKSKHRPYRTLLNGRLYTFAYNVCKTKHNLVLLTNRSA